MTMKKYKLYFDKQDTPFISSYQQKRKYHIVWRKMPYKNGIAGHIPTKIKLYGLFTIYKRKVK